MHKWGVMRKVARPDMGVEVGRKVGVSDTEKREKWEGKSPLIHKTSLNCT
jgi:hypothetical protein